MSKIISVHSFRGGTGKSNIVANMAALLAMKGKRVGVIDTDIQSPGIHVLFGLTENKTNKTLNDYLKNNASIEDAAHEVATSELKANNGTIYLVPSSLKANDISLVLRDGYDVSLLGDGISTLINKLNLDYFLIDTHPGLSEEALLSITISDYLFLLLRPDQQDFQGTAVAVEVAKKLEVANMFLIVNKVLPSLDSEKLKNMVESTYDTKVGEILPLCEEMIQLGSGGLFCLEYKDHILTKKLYNLIDLVLWI